MVADAGFAEMVRSVQADVDHACASKSRFVAKPGAGAEGIVVWVPEVLFVNAVALPCPSCKRSDAVKSTGWPASTPWFLYREGSSCRGSESGSGKSGSGESGSGESGSGESGSVSGSVRCLVSRQYECESCGVGFCGWHPDCLAGLPPVVAEEFPVHLDALTPAELDFLRATTSSPVVPRELPPAPMRFVRSLSLGLGTAPFRPELSGGASPVGSSSSSSSILTTAMPEMLGGVGAGAAWEDMDSVETEGFDGLGFDFGVTDSKAESTWDAYFPEHTNDFASDANAMGVRIKQEQQEQASVQGEQGQTLMMQGSGRPMRAAAANNTLLRRRARRDPDYVLTDGAQGYGQGEDDDDEDHDDEDHAPRRHKRRCGGSQHAPPGTFDIDASETNAAMAEATRTRGKRSVQFCSVCFGVRREAGKLVGGHRPDGWCSVKARKATVQERRELRRRRQKMRREVHKKMTMEASASAKRLATMVTVPMPMPMLTASSQVA